MTALFIAFHVVVGQLTIPTFGLLTYSWVLSRMKEESSYPISLEVAKQQIVPFVFVVLERWFVCVALFFSPFLADFSSLLSTGPVGRENCIENLHH